MNNEMKIIYEVSIQAENCYEDAVKLGIHAAQTIKGNRSQMTNLENIAESSFKTSDIYDYIKRQTARMRFWRQLLPNAKGNALGFGEQLRSYLETNLAKRVDEICSPERLNIGDTTDEQKQERRRIHLLLIRQFIRSMVIHYEYRVSQTNENKK